MANINPTIDRDSVPGITIATYALGNADTGMQIPLPYACDVTAQVSGTFGAATITIEGSNDGTNWNTLGNEEASAMSYTSTVIKTANEDPAYVRAKSTGGTGTAVVVTLAIKARYAKAPY